VLNQKDSPKGRGFAEFEEGARCLVDVREKDVRLQPIRERKGAEETDIKRRTGSNKGLIANITDKKGDIFTPVLWHRDIV
jgi:hypothetical protein